MLICQRPSVLLRGVEPSPFERLVLVAMGFSFGGWGGLVRGWWVGGWDVGGWGGLFLLGWVLGWVGMGAAPQSARGCASAGSF